jgi:hypothetical protein
VEVILDDPGRSGHGIGLMAATVPILDRIDDRTHREPG